MDVNSTYTGKQQLQVSSGECLPMTHTGYIILSTILSQKSITLLNVLCVPKITKNLISISKLVVDNSVSVEFTNKFCVIKDRETKLVLLQRVIKEGLYQLVVPSSGLSPGQSWFSYPRNKTFCFKDENKVALQSNKIDLAIWHKRLGHPCKQTLSKMLSTMLTTYSVSNKDFFCVECQYGKSSQFNFPMSNSRAKAPLELIHFLDDYSRFTWVYPLESKAQVYQVFLQFHKTVGK